MFLASDGPTLDKMLSLDIILNIIKATTNKAIHYQLNLDTLEAADILCKYNYYNKTTLSNTTNKIIVCTEARRVTVADFKWKTVIKYFIIKYYC